MSPRLLALETSGPVASVAVSVDGRVVARRLLREPRRHAARLLTAVGQVMAEAGLRRSDLDGVVVGTGPGSFTGVRVAAAAGKGLAHALRIPLYGVSSLLAAALAGGVPPESWAGWPTTEDGQDAALDPEVDWEVDRDRLVLFDARGDRLFCGCFRLAPHSAQVLDEGADLGQDKGSVEVIEPPAFRHLAELLEDPTCAGAPHCGSGALRHARALTEAGRVVLPEPSGIPSADGLLLHMASPSAPPPLESPFDWEPDYLRETGAVRGRRP